MVHFSMKIYECLKLTQNVVKQLYLINSFCQAEGGLLLPSLSLNFQQTLMGQLFILLECKLNS